MVHNLCCILLRSDKVHCEWLAAIPLWHFFKKQMQPFQHYEFNILDPNWGEIRGDLPAKDIEKWFNMINVTSGYECICQVNI